MAPTQLQSNYRNAQQEVFFHHPARPKTIVHAHNTTRTNCRALDNIFTAIKTPKPTKTYNQIPGNPENASKNVFEVMESGCCPSNPGTPQRPKCWSSLVNLSARPFLGSWALLHSLISLTTSLGWRPQGVSRQVVSNRAPNGLVTG